MIDIDTAAVRRETRASKADHVSAMREVRGIVARLFGGDDRGPAEAKAAFATGGFSRRGFIKFGGVTIASAAVFAACGDDETEATADEEDASNEKASAGDLTILRTATSIELLAVEVYQRVIDSGLVTTTALADAAKLFQEQHGEHAGLFTGATKRRGGEVFDDPNPVLLRALQPTLSAMTTQASALQLAFDLENVAAATYVSSGGDFDDPTLNQAILSVGGVEARHVAVLAAGLGRPAAPAAFQSATGAVAAGTGV